jgi:predicted secreted protein
VSNDGGTTYVPMGGLREATLNLAVDELECTNHDSGGAREFVPNYHDITIDFSNLWDDFDVGQSIVLLAMFAKTVFRARFSLQTLTGAKVFEGEAFATTLTANSPNDDLASFDGTLRISKPTLGYQT